MNKQEQEAGDFFKTLLKQSQKLLADYLSRNKKQENEQMSLEDFGVTRKIIRKTKKKVYFEDTYDLKHPNCPIVIASGLAHDAAYYVDRHVIPAKI